MNKGRIIAFLIGGFVVISTNLGQYVISNKFYNDSKKKLDSKISQLNSIVSGYGQMTSVIAVRTATTIGKEILEQDLQEIQVPYVMSKYFVTDKESIIGMYHRNELAAGSPIMVQGVIENKVDDSVRERDITADIWPIGIKVGDFVDLSIIYPYGEKYLGIPYLRVEAINGKTIKVKLTGLESHIYESIIVDYFLNKGKGCSMLFEKYTDAGVQKPAKQFYSVPKNILAVITADPNILSKINANDNTYIRNLIDLGIGNIPTNVQNSLSSGRVEVQTRISDGQGNLNQKIKEQEEQQKLNPQPPTLPQTENKTPPVNNNNKIEVPTTLPLNIGKGVE